LGEGKTPGESRERIPTLFFKKVRSIWDQKRFYQSARGRLSLIRKSFETAEKLTVKKDGGIQLLSTEEKP